MAITAVRPDGASHLNIFAGAVVQAVVNNTPSGEVPLATTIPAAAALVRFGPLNMPVRVFDDSGTPGGAGAGQQEGLGPHATIDDRTWAKNARVTMISFSGALVNFALDAQNWELDATTGLPILRTLMSISSLPVNVEVQVEIRHTTSR